MQRNKFRNKVKYLALLALSAITLGIERTSAWFDSDFTLFEGGSAIAMIIILGVIGLIVLAVLYVKFFGVPDFAKSKSKSKK